MNTMSIFEDKLNNAEEHYFYLLNKDVVLLKFKVAGQGILEDIEVVEEYVGTPFWIVDKASFIRNRRAPKKRENIAELLQNSGCDTILGYLNITHALSLIDTYWVKPVDSKLQWTDVSLFTHEFNEVIAKTAFEGGLHGYDLETTSPEYGTDGTFAKCWVREEGQIKLMKRGSTGARNAGQEPYSEFYISQVAKALDLNYIDYSLRKHNDRICSVCNAFTSEELGYVPYSAVDIRSGAAIAPILKYYNSYGLEKRVRDMLVFDAVVLNEDRHKGNFGFLVNNDSGKILDMAPLFDHNIALLCYAEKEDFEDIEFYLSQKGPRLGENFVKDARVLLDSDMRKKLINLKGFEFIKHPKYNLPDWKLEQLNKVVNRQIELILEN